MNTIATAIRTAITRPTISRRLCVRLCISSTFMVDRGVSLTRRRPRSILPLSRRAAHRGLVARGRVATAPTNAEEARRLDRGRRALPAPPDRGPKRKRRARVPPRRRSGSRRLTPSAVPGALLSAGCGSWSAGVRRARQAINTRKWAASRMWSTQGSELVGTSRPRAARSGAASAVRLRCSGSCSRRRRHSCSARVRLVREPFVNPWRRDWS